MRVDKLILLLLLLFLPLSAVTIKEKKANLSKTSSDLSPELDAALQRTNREIKAKQKELKEYYQLANELYTEGYDEEDLEEVVEKIQEIKQEIEEIETAWQQKAIDEGRESYALWHQPQTTIEQLVIDYGSSDHVYLIPPDVGSMKVSLSSNLPIPRNSWNEMLELILAQNGIVVEQISPFLKKLSSTKQLAAGLKMITKDREDILLLPSEDRVCFVISPPWTELKRAEQFLAKFINPETQELKLVGKDLLIFSNVGELKKVLNIFDFMHTACEATTYKLITLCKINSDEMAKMLSVLFGADDDKEQKDSRDLVEASGLKVLVLEEMPKALFLVGTKKEIEQAEEIIRRVDAQMADAREKELFWYTCKFTNPEELAEVLDRIYCLMAAECIPVAIDGVAPPPPCYPPLPYAPSPVCQTRRCTPDQLYTETFYQSGDVVVNPAPVTIGPQCNGPPPPNLARQNFIVDPKTGAIVMVVEKDLLPKIIETIRKLDIPKKMVQIEVLLFEKRSSDRNRFSLNLLRLGDAAKGPASSGVKWNDLEESIFNKGILNFFLNIAGPSGCAVANIDFKFLLAQEDVQIHTAPSVLTVNQTEANISIVDEISINTGVYDIPTEGTVALKDSYTRGQYGVNLSITPTVHMTECSPYDDGVDYVTLNTVVNFDTIHKNLENKNRPDVTRRKIENEAVVADGQSVIIGGLKRKKSENLAEKIPFLGDLPLIGKFFASTDYCDQETEMFVMITPRIIKDPYEELECIKREEMKRRPGDLPEYLCRLSHALRCERERAFEGSMQLMFGPRLDRCFTPGWYNDAFCY